MQVSKAKLNKDIKNTMLNIFYQTFADIKNIGEVKTFIDGFFTDMEKISFAKRLMTAYYLEKGKSYEFIKNNIKVSSATIANVDKMMSKRSDGFALALKNIEAEQWASQTSQKISQFIKNITG